MTPFFNQDIIGVDTLQVRDASEAFIHSGAAVSSDVAEAAVNLNLWGSDPINSILVVLCTLAGIACIPRLLTLAPYIWGSLLRWKETARLYASVRLSRDRNILAQVSILPICLLASRYSLIRYSFMEGWEIWEVTLGMIGLFIIYYLLRAACSAMLPSFSRWDEIKIAESNSLNGFIVISLSSTACAGLCALFGVSEYGVSVILKHLIALIYIVFLYRNWQILSWKGRRFKAFLYLCALELVPVVLLAAGAIIF